jgi:glutathione S-transferase
MNTRVTKCGPYVLGDRFSLADFYLSYWMAFLDRDVMCQRFSSIAKLYHLVKARPSATAYLEEVERAAEIFGRI